MVRIEHRPARPSGGDGVGAARAAPREEDQRHTVAEHERIQRLEAEHRRLLYAWAKAQFSAEELDRAEQDPEEFTTAEVLKHLETL